MDKSAGRSEPGGDAAIHAGSRLLRRGALVAEVMEPDHPERYNTGTRFTPLAAVLRVNYDGTEYLLNPVDHTREHQVAGLMAEFDIYTPGGPPGFADADLGEGFVKIGVGVLKKTEEKYRFWPTGEFLRRPPTKVEWHRDRAVFAQTVEPARGYAYKLKAELALVKNRIEIVWTLKNTGEKDFRTVHYSHNCTRIGPAPVKDQYTVTFDYDIDIEKLSPEQEHDGRVIRYRKPIPKATNNLIRSKAEGRYPNRVTVRNEKAGRWVRYETDRPSPTTALHATREYVCPEQFVEISLTPGEATAWTRIYVFGGKDDK